MGGKHILKSLVSDLIKIYTLLVHRAYQYILAKTTYLQLGCADDNFDMPCVFLYNKINF